jgi:predicted transposase YbfD/YdcC
LLQCYEINRSRPEARSLQRWEVTAAAVGFPHAQQAAELRRFVDRAQKPNAKKDPEVELEFLLTSLPASQLDVTAMLRLDREYWGIENGLHLRLDGAGQEDKSRVRSRLAAFNLCLFRRAATTFAVHWIQRQPNPRLATTQGFHDEMSAHGHRKAFSLVTTRKPSWIPRK